ncbi:IscS subfamily cysteine desulfurase, partial [Francisella tularensis subsp. holarctica]|nr:IscS subfamily cysteine desulfurase [Francisella tularensis subsp. holarctica]
MSLIYLDYAATTTLSQSVKNSMLNSITSDDDFFNSGSLTYQQAEIVSNQI